MTAPSGVQYKKPPIDKIGGSANLGATNNPSAVNAATPTPFAVTGNNVAGYAGVSQEYRNYSGGTDPRNQPLPAVQTMLGASNEEFEDGVAPRRMSAEELVDNDVATSNEAETKAVTKVVKARAKAAEEAANPDKVANEKRASELDKREKDVEAREAAVENSAKADAGDASAVPTAPKAPSAGSKTTTGGTATGEHVAGDMTEKSEGKAK